MIALVLVLAWASSASAETSDATLLRVFLQDGTAVVSFGEYARVGDRVIFSMPIGPVTATPRLHVVSLPSSAVDWTATERYTAAARYVRYTSTRAEHDFGQLSNEVARLLNAIALTAQPLERLQLAERARRMLAAWPGEHYGYRAADVAQILSLVDEAVTELRAAAGRTDFDLNLVATYAPPAPVTTLPEPSDEEAYRHALVVARLTDVPSERLSLLQSIAAALRLDETLSAAAWVRDLSRAVSTAIATETRIERAYQRLSSTLLERGWRAAARADVRGVERLLIDAKAGDRALGGQRPDHISGLLAALADRLDRARSLRLARDRWALREPALRAYQELMGPVFRQLDRLARPLEDIRSLAGPRPRSLSALGFEADRVSRALALITPPDELRDAHEHLVSAIGFTTTAVRLRRDAVESGDVPRAWDASSAAAGALALVARARADMEQIFQPPRLR